jgi:hypothetical protein
MDSKVLWAQKAKKARIAERSCSWIFWRVFAFTERPRYIELSVIYQVST